MKLLDVIVESENTAAFFANHATLFLVIIVCMIPICIACFVINEKRKGK